jgi:hypothetical protein
MQDSGVYSRKGTCAPLVDGLVMLRCLFQAGRTLCGVVYIRFLAIESGTQRCNVFFKTTPERGIFEMWLQSIVQPQLSCAFACTDTGEIKDSSILKFTSFRVLFET